MGKKYKVLFDIYHLYHLPQFEPVIEVLKSTGNFDIYYSIPNTISKYEYQMTLKVLNNKGNGKSVLAKDEEERKKTLRHLNLDVFISGWSRYPIQDYVSNDTVCALIYHGIGIKPPYYRDYNPRLNIRFVEGYFRLKQLQEKGLNNCELVLTGFTKLDPLFNNEFKKLIEKNIYINKTKKTILFAPTFYPSSLEVFEKKILDYTADYNLIIKPHSWSYFLDKFSGVKLGRQIKLLNKLKKINPNIIITGPDDYNILPYYKIADVLITEASSTMYEFMALKKPVILCDFYKKKLSHVIFPKRIYRKRLDKFMAENMTKIFIHISKTSELPQSLKYACSENFTYDEEWNSYIEDMLYKIDGKASHRVIDYLNYYLSKRK